MCVVIASSCSSIARNAGGGGVATRADGGCWATLVGVKLRGEVAEIFGGIKLFHGQKNFVSTHYQNFEDVFWPLGLERLE